jgi:hypothetical protein
LNFAVVSPPIRLRIVEAPVVLSIDPANDVLTVGSSNSLKVTVLRRFGFTGKVVATAEFAAGFTGLELAPFTLEEVADTGSLVFTVAPNATLGTHPVVLHFRGQFNKVDFDAVTKVNLTVGLAPTASAAERDKE